jgi:phospholipase C
MPDSFDATMRSPQLSRRDLLRAGAAAGALASLEPLAAHAQVLERALAIPARRKHVRECDSLSQIEHVVIFINENRSFDSYFGTYNGVRGYGDRKALRLNDGSGKPIFAQPFGASPEPAPKGFGGHLLPFHFDTTTTNGECVADISHEWKMLHECWNGGALDKFLESHLKAKAEGGNPKFGYNTMGYYTKQDLPFFHALAENFTICDHYFCSVLGPTDPNRLYSMSATIDVNATGGPSLQTQASERANYYYKFTWPTYPEQLQAAGVTWKVYATEDGRAGDDVLRYFKAYETNAELAKNAFTPSFPADFKTDCEAGTLPQVSWVLASLTDSEHPPAPVTSGEAVLSEVLSALTANPAVWEKSALFSTYDENGGFFDHVPPPTPPPGTPGEELTHDSTLAGGFKGPIGLGFRVPMLVISPFSRGGLVCSKTFDHTSLLRFLERRFGPEVPNLSAWRREHTGDLTAAFSFDLAANTSLPSLPSPSRADERIVKSNCSTQAADTGSEEAPGVEAYPLPPPPQAMPRQERGKRRRPRGC